jgi:hypothetical protein
MPSYLLTFRGTVCAGSEEFSHSLTVDDAGTGDPTPETIAAVGVEAVQEMLAVSTFNSLFPTGTVWTTVTAAEILNLSDGTLSAAFNAALPTALTGQGAQTLPPQCAVAVSLVAGTYANGTPLRGRFFLPTPSALAISSTTGQLASAAQTGILDGVEAFLNHFVQPTRSMAPQVWSRGPHAESKAPRGMSSTQTVETVSVGKIVDTIRSRRGDLPEAYVSRTLSSV